jgi:hypothetical protein
VSPTFATAGTASYLFSFNYVLVNPLRQWDTRRAACDSMHSMV